MEITGPTQVAVTIGTDETLLVASTGSITVDTLGNAVNANGDNIRINVLGQVTNQNDNGTGIRATPGTSPSGSFTISVTGSVHGGGFGVFGSSGTQLVVENYGTISGGKSAILARASALTLINKGTISGQTNIDAVSDGAIVGGAFADTIINEGMINGGDITLGDGSDTYYGRNGQTTSVIKLGYGDDRAYGGAGAEAMAGGMGDDILDGGDGIDTAIYTDSLSGIVTVNLGLTGPQDTGEGVDTLIGIENLVCLGSVAANFTGNGLDNVLVGYKRNDTLKGGGGNDTLFGATGDDIFDGGEGADTVTFSYSYFGAPSEFDTVGATVDLNNTGAQDTGYGNDIFIEIENLVGTSWNDKFTGNDAANTFTGRGGNDTLDGAGGNDILIQEVGDGDDFLVGGSGIDTVSFSGAAGASINLSLTTAQNTAYGSDIFSGIENLFGGSGNDRFIGSKLANTLNGNAGDDTLSGGAGNDVLYGGAGRDIFVFNTALNAKTNKDRILDWKAKDDTIQLENAVFKKLTKTGVLNKAYFVIGAVAKDANDFVGYNRATGDLWYDSNGSASGGQVVFANIGKNKAIAHNDFVVI